MKDLQGASASDTAAVSAVTERHDSYLVIHKALRALRGVYLLVGLAMGIAMGATGDFGRRPVHAHVNLLGWVGLAITAGMFRLWPRIAESRLAHAFSWTYNLSLPAMLGALTFYLRGHAGALPVLVAGEIGTFSAATILVAGLILATRTAPRTADHALDFGRAEEPAR